MKKFILSAAMLAAALSAGAMQSDTIFAADYGIVPDTYRNQTPAFRLLIDAAAKRPGSVIALQPGRYDLWPEGAVRRELFVSNTTSETEAPDKTKTFGLYFGDVSDLTLDGRRATLMMHGDMTTVGLVNARNVELKNLTIDFERPGGSEMTYVKVEPGYVRLRVHPDSRYEIVDRRLRLVGEGWRSNRIHCIKYNPEARELRYSDDWNVLARCDVRELEPGLLEFKVDEKFRPTVGHTLTLRDIIRYNTGMLNYHSSGTTLRDVNMRYMHVLGIVSHFSRDITMERVHCAPAPESGRVLASSADFMHFSGCSGHIEIRDCKYSGAQDDAINVHGTNLQLIRRTGRNKALLRFMHHQTYGFTPFAKGDTVAFVTANSMQRTAYTTVSGLKRLSDRDVEVTFATPIPAEVKDNETCVENMTATPTVHISGCDLSNLSTRGILMTTPRRAVIENNRFSNLGMAAVLIEADAEGWYESGPVRDITIRNNTFTNCNYTGTNFGAAISINPSNTVGSDSTAVHEGIVIEGNTFDNGNRPLLWAKSTGRLTFTGNRSLQRDNRIILKWCSDVNIDGNDAPNLTVDRK